MILSEIVKTCNTILEKALSPFPIPLLLYRFLPFTFSLHLYVSSLLSPQLFFSHISSSPLLIPFFFPPLTLFIASNPSPFPHPHIHTLSPPWSSWPLPLSPPLYLPRNASTDFFALSLYLPPFPRPDSKARIKTPLHLSLLVCYRPLPRHS